MMQSTPANPDSKMIDQQQRNRILKSYFGSSTITACCFLAITVLTALERSSGLKWIENVSIPFIVLVLPGASVFWMTYLPLPLISKIGPILIFNTLFYAVLIFSVWEIARYKRTIRSLHPALGLFSLVMLMFFVAVFNYGEKFVVIGHYLMPNYPGWPIYVFGLIFALAAGFRARKGWVYLLPYVWVPIPLFLQEFPNLRALSGSIF